MYLTHRWAHISEKKILEESGCEMTCKMPYTEKKRAGNENEKGIISNNRNGLTKGLGTGTS